MKMWTDTRMDELCQGFGEGGHGIRIVREKKWKKRLRVRGPSAQTRSRRQRMHWWLHRTTSDSPPEATCNLLPTQVLPLQVTLCMSKKWRVRAMLNFALLQASAAQEGTASLRELGSR
jgi:hypothetical protein